MVDRHQLQAKRRSTMAHELVHGERRVFHSEPALRARGETLVEQTAARRLIELGDLLDALRVCFTRCADSLADHLWVDRPTLEARINALNPCEVADFEHHHLDGPMAIHSLTERDTAILDLEAKWWQTAGGKEEAIRAMGLTPSQHHQLLNRLLATEKAVAYAAVTAHRLNRLQSSKRSRRLIP